MWAYQAFTVTWLVFGLGYIFMIVTVIADNLRKPARKAVKKFRVAEQKVLSNKILQELLDMKEQNRWQRYLPKSIDYNEDIFVFSSTGADRTPTLRLARPLRKTSTTMTSMLAIW